MLALLATLGLAFAAVAGGKIKTKTFSSGSIAVPIPDEDVATTSVKVGGGKKSKVKDVNVSVRLDHTNTGDLVVELISPRGKSVRLSDTDSSGDDWGSGPNSCAGTPLTFDDEAGTALADGTDPYAGSFRPNESLSAFDGSKMKGYWDLVVADVAFADEGTIGCVDLEIKYKKKKPNN